jgi:2-(1,2-epoxy-1,2-dihydrophenyl)acetyl-CoA isomerase
VTDQRSENPQPSPVRVDVLDAVATITLDRPGAMNALDVATKVALREAVRSLAADAAVRAVVLTGSGRAFCVGQDLQEHVRNLEDDASAAWTTVREHYNPLVTALATMPKPVVAAVNGVAAGAGASLAFACDFRVVADTAGFNLAFSAVGLSADSGASWTLPRLVGHAKAMELLVLGGTVPAEEAQRLGLVTQLVPGSDVLRVAQELAARLAAGPTVAYGCIKRAVAFSSAHRLEESLAFEDQMQNIAGTTEDHRAATLSFVAKEKPVFTGR